MAQVAVENLKAAEIERPKDANGVAKPIPNTADSGYFSADAVAGLEKMGLDPHLATGRQKHHETAPAAAAAEPTAEASVKEKMQHKLRTAAGKALYAAQAHHRAGLRPDQRRAWHPQVSAAQLGEGIRRMEPDLPDPQSSEDLATVHQRGDRLRGPVPHRDGGRGQQWPRRRDQWRYRRDAGEFSDRLLAAANFGWATRKLSQCICGTPGQAGPGARWTGTSAGSSPSVLRPTVHAWCPAVLRTSSGCGMSPREGGRRIETTCRTLGVSPEQDMLATTGTNEPISLWNLRTGKLLRQLPNEPTNSLAFSPDGKRLVSGGLAAAIGLWDVATGKEAVPLIGHRHMVLGLAFSPDGQQLASLGGDQTVRTWALPQGKCMQTLRTSVPRCFAS